MTDSMTLKNPPIIGVTTYGRNEGGRYHLPAEYVQAVRKAGGIPVLLPPGETQVERLIQHLDGVIFAGGGDIDPSRYRGQNHPAINRVDGERDEFELRLAQRLRECSMPVLGICRGSQVLLVASGGKLLEHVPDAVGNLIEHRGRNGLDALHEVEILPGTRLAAILQTNRFTIVSKHHQGFKEIPQEWHIAAKSPDGLVEALENKTHPWMIAVLWHPELSMDDPPHVRLFGAFVQACANYKNQKKEA